MSDFGDFLFVISVLATVVVALVIVVLCALLALRYTRHGNRKRDTKDFFAELARIPDEDVARSVREDRDAR